MPKVTVIMPVYNAQKYIKKAIDSILTQSFQDFELLLIDDCSTDRTMEVVECISDKRIRIIHNDKNIGIAQSRNKGIENSRGKYIALMDDDDIAALSRLEKEVNYLEQHKDIDVVGGRFCVIDENDDVTHIFPEPLYNPEFIKASLMFYNPIGNGSAMLRKRFILDEAIRYKDDCLGMEDYRFWIECSLKGRITNLNEMLLFWRQSAENESSRVNQVEFVRRAKKFSEMQEFALYENGYHLETKELQLIHRMFPEDIRTNVAERQELELLYDILKNYYASGTEPC